MNEIEERDNSESLSIQKENEQTNVVYLNK